MNAIDYSGALATVRELCDRTNLYIEESAPWALAKLAAEAPLPADAGRAEDSTQQVEGSTPLTEPTPQDRLAFVLYNTLEAIRIMALLFAPVMPASSAEVFSRLSLKDPATTTDLAQASQWGGLGAGNTITIGEPLFPRFSEDDLELD
jgi:methionyl-tRNA synthetase